MASRNSEPIHIKQPISAGTSGETFLTDVPGVVAWVPNDYESLHSFACVQTALQEAGFRVKSRQLLDLNQNARTCILYEHGERLDDDQTNLTLDETILLTETTKQWVTALLNKRLSHAYIDVRHVVVIRNETTETRFALTGMDKVIKIDTPPTCFLRAYGDYCPIGDAPLCFFPSHVVDNPDVIVFIMHHAVAVLQTLVLANESAEVTKCSRYSASCNQLKLSETTDLIATIKKIIALPKVRVTDDVMTAAISVIERSLKGEKCICC